jgi:hypothetical protein
VASGALSTGAPLPAGHMCQLRSQTLHLLLSCRSLNGL